MIGTEDSKNICNAKSVKLVTTAFIRGHKGRNRNRRKRQEGRNFRGRRNDRAVAHGTGDEVWRERERERLERETGGGKKGRGGTKTSM